MSKVVVITGSSRGLGLATAEACLAAGASVAISSENTEELEAAPVSDDERVLRISCDVTSEADVRAQRDAAIQRFGRIDAWINNAGTSAPTGATRDVVIATGRQVLGVNILGTYFGSVHAMRQFRKQGSGRLINIVGRGEKHPVPTGALYGSSKASRAGIHPLRKVIAVIGETPENAARKLAELALRDSRAPAENGRSRISVLLPKVLRRLVLREAPPIDPETVELIRVEPERD